MHISNKLWEIRQQSKLYEDLIQNITKQFNISSITARVLLNRGLTSPEDINKFLNTNIEDFYDPFLLKDMEKAVKRIIKAINNNEKIVIFGDYDVDGITSTSILMNYIGKFTQNIDFYIPDRIEEGYGLSKSSIDKIIDMDTNLIITVDCGITALGETEYARRNNIDIVITDHHECKDVLPDACAVVNPKRKDCKYPFKELAGVGVVFKLVQALAQELNSTDVIDEYIEIAAFGTIADVVPLLDENRIIVKYGLEKIKTTNKLGLKSLIEISGLEPKNVTTTNIGYILAPRINAAGRVGDARRGVELFLSKDEQQAYQIALELDKNNRERQQIENNILNTALEMILENEEFARQKVIVLASEGWHHGVIGIVASRLTEKFNKPTILISIDGDEGKGSGRSIPKFNIFEALMQCSKLLGKFGGHELAVGLSIHKEKIGEFRELINNYADKILSEDDFCPKIKVDAEICRRDINLELLDELKKLEPYGIANPCPVFLYNGLKVVDCKTVGENRHIKLKMEDQDLYMDAIGFNLGELAPKIDILDKIDVVCSLELNSWNGQQKIQLNIKDLRTNHEILFKEKYFDTLERSIFSNISINDMDTTFLNKIKIFNEDILSLIDNNQKNLILINTLKGARDFIRQLKDLKQEHKEMFKLFYNCIQNDTYSSNIVIINPHFSGIEFSKFDNIFMYDLCFSKKQYDYLLNNAKNLYIMNGFSNASNNIDVFHNIIPQRDELIKVYQYIVNRSSDQTFESNIFSLTREIAISYNIDINSLKLKKILEIFQEMNLAKLDVEDELYKIKIIRQRKAKVNINESKGLAKLLKIKDEFDYFMKYLKEKQIC